MARSRCRVAAEAADGVGCRLRVRAKSVEAFMALQINANMLTITHTHTACGTFHTQREAETRADKHAYGLPIEQLTLWAICFGHTLIWLWPAKSNAGAMKN